MYLRVFGSTPMLSAEINSVVEEWFISSALGAEARRFESDLRYQKNRSTEREQGEVINHRRLSDNLYLTS